MSQLSVRWRTAGVSPIWLVLLLVQSVLAPAAQAEIVLVSPTSSSPVELPLDERARLD